MDILVLTIQFKFRLLVMIKLPYPPVIGIMANLALLPHSAFMYIVLFVAAATIPVKVLVFIVYMTFFTGLRGMHAQQGEFGDVMVEHHLFLPAVGIMTIIAVLALLSFMNIVLAVA